MDLPVLARAFNAQLEALDALREANAQAGAVEALLLLKLIEGAAALRNDIQSLIVAKEGV